MNFLGQGFQKLEHYKKTDTQTQTNATENTAMPHSRVVNIGEFKNLNLVQEGRGGIHSHIICTAAMSLPVTMLHSPVFAILS